MNYTFDKSIVINLDHAYAAAGKINNDKMEEIIIKTEQLEGVTIKTEVLEDDTIRNEEIVIKTELPEENTIKTEDLTIKTELPDDLENYESIPCDNSFEHLDVKPDVTEFSNYDASKDKVVLHSDNKYTIIEKEALRQIQKKLANKERKVKDLTKEKRSLNHRNQILKQQFKELQKCSQAKIDVLMDKNEVFQIKVKDFDEIKKNYRLLEEQMINLTSKIWQFMDNTLPKFFSQDGIVNKLKSQVTTNDEQYQYLGATLGNLMGSVASLKQEAANVTEINKNNFINATKRAEELESKLRNSIETKEIREKQFKEFQDAAIKEKLKIQDELRKSIRDYTAMKMKYKHCYLRIEMQQKQKDKIKRKLQIADTNLSQAMKENGTLRAKLNKLNNEIEVLKNQECEYCGF